MSSRGKAPVDLTSPVGKIRLLLGDTDAANVADGQGDYAWYSDDELTALLELHGGDPAVVAVGVLRLIAVSQSLKLKKWSQGELAVDGPAVTRALLDAADKIEAGLTAAARGEDEGFSMVVPTGPTPDAADWSIDYYGRLLPPSVPFGII